MKSARSGRDKSKKGGLKRKPSRVAKIESGESNETPAQSPATLPIGRAQSPSAFLVQVHIGDRDRRPRTSVMFIAVVETPARAIAAVRAVVEHDGAEVTANTFPVGPETVKAMGLAAGQVKMVNPTNAR
jgi:hypothetical protein